MPPLLNEPSTSENQLLNLDASTETSVIESLSQDSDSFDEFQTHDNLSTTNDLFLDSIRSKTSVFASPTIHINDEKDLSKCVFKLLCFFEPTNGGKLKCKLKHAVSSGRALVPIFDNLSGHLKFTHGMHGFAYYSELPEYSDGQVSISLTTLVMSFIKFC